MGVNLPSWSQWDLCSSRLRTKLSVPGLPGELGGGQRESPTKPLTETAATDPRQSGNYICS